MRRAVSAILGINTIVISGRKHNLARYDKNLQFIHIQLTEEINYNDYNMVVKYRMPNGNVLADVLEMETNEFDIQIPNEVVQLSGELAIEFTLSGKENDDSLTSLGRIKLTIQDTLESNIDQEEIRVLPTVANVLSRITERTNDGITEIEKASEEKINDINSFLQKQKEQLADEVSDYSQNLTNQKDNHLQDLDSKLSQSKDALDVHEKNKEQELTTHLETTKQELDAHEKSHEQKIDAFVKTKEEELNAHKKAKEEELNSHEKAKEQELDNFTESKKEQIETQATEKITSLEDKTKECIEDIYSRKADFKGEKGDPGVVDYSRVDGVVGECNGAFPLSKAKKGEIYYSDVNKKYYICIESFTDKKLNIPNTTNFEKFDLNNVDDKVKDYGIYINGRVRIFKLGNLKIQHLYGVAKGQTWNEFKVEKFDTLVYAGFIYDISISSNCSVKSGKDNESILIYPHNDGGSNGGRLIAITY